MKTLLNEPINEDTLGILYICDYEFPTLTPINAIQFDDPALALHYYGEVPNPPSQVAYGNTREKFLEELGKLHHQMANPKWQEQLAETL